MSVPTADSLRTMNLAYRRMQEDFASFAEGLFRGSENITTDASGYLILPTYITEVEKIVTSSNTDEEWSKIDKHQMYWATGWYHDGINTTQNKRQLMVRDSGAAKATATFTVHYLREFADLTATTDPPIPFIGKRYLDMLTTLQAYYYYEELGKEKEEDKKEMMASYQDKLELARKSFLDDFPDYGRTRHSDAGTARRYPILHPSTS